MAQTAAISSPTVSPNSGYVLAAAGAILFSTKGILIKLAYGGDAGHIEVDAITLLTLRMAFSLPLYAVIGIMAWRTQRREGRPLPPMRALAACTGIGLMGYYASAYLDFQGLVYLSAQFERLLLFTYPLFVMLIGAAFFGGKLSVWGMSSLVFTYAGIAVIFTGGVTASGDHVLLGAGFVLTAAFTFSIYQLIAGALIKQIGARIFTCIAMAAAGAATLVHFLATHNLGALFSISPRIVGLAALMAVFATVLPSFMLNMALGRISAQAVSVIGTVSPVATIVMAVMLVGEPFTATDGLGTAMVIGGVGLYTWYDSRTKQRMRAAEQ